MFSWSSNSNSNAKQQRRPSSSSTYPAQRVAQPVQGSIRPPAEQTGYSRSQQIDSYLKDETLKRSTRKVSADDSTYDTVFQTTAGDALILRVHLPAYSPSSTTPRAPQMTLVGVRAKHGWLDSRMRVVGFAPIQSDQAWTESRTLLGPAVHQVVKHFQLQPPQLLEITDAGLRRLQSNLPQSGAGARPRTLSATSNNSNNDGAAAPPDYESLFRREPQQQQQPVAPPTLPNMPDIPTNYTEFLDTMSREDMEQLLNDELDFLAFASTLPAYQEIQKVGSNAFDENVQMAQANLEEEERLMQLHKDVTELQQSLQTKLAAFETLEQKQDTLCAAPDKRMVLKQLAKAKRQAMDESEQFAETWVQSGKGNIDDFVETFMEKRTLHHVRAAKMECLQRQT